LESFVHYPLPDKICIATSSCSNSVVQIFFIWGVWTVNWSEWRGFGSSVLWWNVGWCAE